MKIEIGTKVMRVADGYHYEQAGIVIEQTDTRIRVMWKNKDGSDDRRTWVAKSAKAKRWTELHGPADDTGDAWDQPETSQPQVP